MLWLVAAAWLIAYLLVSRHLVLLLPEVLTRQLTMGSYLLLVQLLVAAFGLCLVVLSGRRDPLVPTRLVPLLPTDRRRSLHGLAWAIGLAPLVHVLAHASGMTAAYQTLLAELAARGAQAVQQQAGEFGRSTRFDTLWTILPLTLLVAPLCEELLFRGAVYGALDSACRPSTAGRGTPIPGLTTLSDSLGKRLRSLLPWWGSTLLFGALHADMAGGMGIMRTVSTSVLGLACGFARLRTGHLLAPIALHVTYNAAALAALRGWLVFPHFPQKYALPTSLLVIAPVCALVALVLTRRLPSGR